MTPMSQVNNKKTICIVSNHVNEYLTVPNSKDSSDDDSITNWNVKHCLQCLEIIIEDIEKVEQLSFDDRIFGDESSIEIL